MPKFSQAERGILAIVATLLLVFSYFLYDDSLLFQPEHLLKTGSIGDISFSENDVRRKSNENFSWLPATKKDLVFQQDSIYTGNDSNAEITLMDGTVIEIQPNSLVTLNIRDGQMSLNLSYGNLVGQVGKGSALTVKSGAEEFKLKGDNSKIQFNKNSNGKIDMNLISGKALVSNKSGKAIELKKVLEESSTRLELVTASGATISKFADSEPIILQWRGAGPIAKYELRVAKDINFSSLISQEFTKNQKANIVRQMPNGKYFWQVQAFRKNGSLITSSETRDFTVMTFKSPQISTPVAQAVISLEMPGTPEELKSKTKVTWTSISEYPQYRIQVAKDANFTELLKDILTPAKDSLTPDLSSGTYYTRVLGVNTDKKISSRWSAPVTFTLQLTALKEQAPLAPILLSNKVFFKVPKTTDRNPAAIPGPVMAWKPVPNVPMYRLQIAKSKEFTDTSEFDVNDVRAVWPQYRPGKHYYRVFSLSPSGLISLPSEIGEMFVNVDSPTLAAIDPIRVRGNETPPPQNVDLTWSQVPFAKSYLLQYDQDEKFTNPLQLEFSSTAGQIQLPTTGQYHVRVKAIDENNIAVGGYSNSGLAVYQYENPLLTPILSEPFDKVSIFLQKEATPYLWLEWKSVDGAQNYMIEISSTSDFSKVLVAKSVAENRFLINNQIPTGRIFWRVRALSVDTKSESDWSAQREFVLFQKKNEIFVK